MTFDIRTRTGAEEGQQLCRLRVTQQHLGLIDTDKQTRLYKRPEGWKPLLLLPSDNSYLHS